MRAISTIAGISFSLFAVGVSPSCAHEAVHSTQSDGIKSLGYGTNIQWSPYSTRVSFVSNGRLMIYDIASTVTKDAGPIDGREYAWTSETQIVDMRSTWDEIRQVFDVSLSYYTVDDSGLMSVDSINSRAFYAESPPKLLKSRTSVFLWGINKERAANLVAERNSPISIAQQTQDVGCNYIKAETHFVFPKKNGPTYYGDSDVWLIDRTGFAVKRIAMDTKVRFPQLSPTCELFTCTDFGGYQRIYDTLGTLVCKFYGADWTVWVPDGSGLVFCRLAHDGDPGRLVGGDLFLYDLENHSETQLTFTSEIPELRPSISPDGKWLTYVVQLHENQSEIYFEPYRGGNHE